MSGMSTYLANAVINATLRSTSFTSPSTVYLALFLTDPTDGGTGAEVSGASYVRKAISLTAPSNGITTNSSAVTFDAATTDWGTVTYIAIYDALTGGNLLYSDPLTTSETITTNELFSIPASGLTITLA